jgi:hypothetical protein
MIAFAKPPKRKEKSNRNDATFESMLPAIRRQAKHAFRAVRGELREELVAEVVANSFVAFRRLVKRDKADLAYPSVLARFAIQQVRMGRRVGSTLNVRDVTSHYCQRMKGVRLQRLEGADDHRGRWEEIVVEDKTATPADIVAIRIDFAAWLKSLDRKRRQIVNVLATGETTKETARKFKLCPGRISQIRSELRDAWYEFQGETVAS